MAPADSVLRIRDLTITPQGERARPIVDGVDLDIAPGETLALVGESGSGKSMTARSILRLLPRDFRVEASELMAAGTDVLHADAGALRRLRGGAVGMIFQDPMINFNPVLPVGQQVVEPLAIRASLSKSEASRRAAAALARVGINEAEQRAREYPHQFSGGMLQRAMVAMALMNRPQLIVADEPTTALDATLQVKMVELMREMQAEVQASVLLITHDLGLAAELGDRVAFMQGGKIVETGDLQKVFDAPEHDYTRELLMSRPERMVVRRSAAEAESFAIEVSSVSKSFQSSSFWFRSGADSTRAVDAVSFEVRRGETFGLVGESGSGKSTLGRLMIGLLVPDSGTIRVADRSDTAVIDRDRLHRTIQWVHQDPYGSLNPKMKVGALLEEVLRRYGLHSDRRIERCVELVERMRLPKEFLDRYPHQLSGGQRQRVSIARGRAFDPRPGRTAFGARRLDSGAGVGAA